MTLHDPRDPHLTNNAPTVSVTMAAYNVVEYVAESLDSVLAQEWTDFEFIIVDDASTDGTREILKSYAARDSRIRLFLKDRNEGLAVARNFCISEARGYWLTFLDADDLYSTDMLRSAVEAGCSTGADMVLWDYVVFSQVAEIHSRQGVPSELHRTDPANRLALLGLPAFAWTRLVSRDALQRLQISFPPGLTYQDVPVHWQLVTQLEKIVLIPKRLAFYRQQPRATTAGKGMKRADYFTVLDQIEVYLRKNDLFEIYSDALTARQLNAWYGVYDVIGSEHRSVIIEMIRSRFATRHGDYLAAGKPLRSQARAFFMAMNGSRLAEVSLSMRNFARWIYRHLKVWG